MPEPFECAICGSESVIRVTENCRLSRGVLVRRLKHFKCQKCGERFFDDYAMDRIHAERMKHGSEHAA